jgi:hypothetical protein
MPLKLPFHSLSLSERYTYISDHGKYIGVRNYYNHAINLHLVDETFYEVWYFIPDNKIEKIEPLEDIKKLDLYIKHMNEPENI